MRDVLDYCFFEVCSYPEHCLLRALGVGHENNSIVWIVDNHLTNVKLTLNYQLFEGIPSVLLPVTVVNSCMREEWRTCHSKQK